MVTPLTDARIRQALPDDRQYKLGDGHRLFLLIFPSGRKAWRYKYRLGGKENLFAVGDYPRVGIRQAREVRDWARNLVDVGIHPSHRRKEDRQKIAIAAANTFECIARDWIDEHRERWTPYYLSQVERAFGNDVYPRIGKMPIKLVDASQVLDILKAVAARDAATVAILIRQWCSAVFRYAVATRRADADPTAVLKGAISRRRVEHKKALEAKDIGKLREKLRQSSGAPSVRIALQLLLLTFVRPGELRGALWSEFDLAGREWRIPAARMKMREPHFVPLSTQAVDLLTELKSLSGEREQLFPNVRDPQRTMSPTTLNRSLERMGYGGEFSAHGFRATAATILNEMNYKPDVIERQLAHRERNQVRASYNHASYMPERRAMMQAWADFVDECS